MTALPPMMGWSTWNLFKQNISEQIVLEMARAIQEKGLLKAGYCYINLDDCWQASSRDEKGRLSFDQGRFPSREAIVGKLNAMGFQVGIYSSCGNYTCEDMPGSFGFEEIDAKTFADWGMEYLKYDYCHVVDLPTDPHFQGDNFATKTPPILYLGISGLGEDGAELVLESSKARLAHPACLDQGTIIGLNCPKGTATFTVFAPKKGAYQLAVGYVKEQQNHKQFLLASINGDSQEQIWFPPTSGWFSPARVMVKIYLKEGENKITLHNPIRGQKEDATLRYLRMGEALKKATEHKKSIYYSICEHGRTKPWIWAREVASSWRITGDIADSWESVMACYEAAVELQSYQQPGAYNDPDMLEVGVGNLTEIENQSHFVLWCMLSAPLVLGLDVRKADDKTLALITNTELIGINQDGLLRQAKRFVVENSLDLLVKPLMGGRHAFCLLNKSKEPMHHIGIDLEPFSSIQERLEVVKLEPREVFWKIFPHGRNENETI